MASIEQQSVLHFSIGPVQDFIETARTTRDLWTGSYILSLANGACRGGGPRRTWHAGAGVLTRCALGEVSRVELTQGETRVPLPSIESVLSITRVSIGSRLPFNHERTRMGRVL